MSNTANVGFFLIQTLFDLFLTVLWLRFLLQWVRANFFHPVCQLIAKVTQPILTPLQKFLPTINKNINTAVLVAILVTALVKVLLLALLSGASIENWFGLIIWAIGDILLSLVDLYFFAMLIFVILSWISTPQSASIQEILYRILAPLLEPVRRLLPAVAGFDLTPIPVLLGLKLISLFLLKPIIAFGFALMVGA
jgi:YggT family protein